MIMSSQTVDLEARFGHLLQPIRDLTKNWDVDIARYLEEYLGDLEKVVVTFNCGETTMNFAEAALLIQGSACVYSKKVEYLYSLAYQVLEIVVNKKKNQKASSVDAEGNDADAEFPEEDKEEFLSLDDTKAAKLEKLQNRDDPEKESRVHPQIPMNLIAQEDGEKYAGELNNHKGEVLGSLSDFQMNCSSVQAQGGVYLDTNLLPLLHSRLHLLASSTPFPVRERPALEKSPEEKVQHIDVPEAPPAPDLSMDVDCDGGLQAEPDDDEPPAQQDEECAAKQSERKKVQFNVLPPKPVVDHWALKDPYSKGKLAEKELKTGQTFRVPAELGPAGPKKRKRKTLEKKATQTPISEFLQTRFYSHRPKFPKNPDLVPSFPEFDDMFWKEFKRRQEGRRQKQKQQVLQDAYETEQGRADDADIYNWPAPLDDGGDVDDQDADHFDSFEPLQIQLDDQAFAPIEACGGEFINSLGSSGSTYEDIVRQHVENYLTEAAKFAQISELSKRVAEWEEKITPKLQEEEQREAFDIHKYGTNVIDGLQKNQCVPFRKIVCGKPLFQICRLFLATLQLANTYNVEISCPGTLSEAMDRLQIRLMSTKRHYEELADYQVPSMAGSE